MQLPRYKSKCGSRRTLKLCHVCGKEYWGRPPSKYCEIHMDQRTRPRKRSATRDIFVGNNVTIEHGYKESTDILRQCDTCGTLYGITLVPKQFVYPSHCPDHRSEHRRADWAKRHKVGV